MSVRELVLLVALGGCNRLWGLTAVTTSPDAPGGDVGTPIADRCIPTFPSDTFDDSPPCIGVGVPLGNADVLNFDDDTLLVTLPGTASDLGGCLSHAVVAFGPGGIFANVLTIASGSNDFNFFALHWADNMNTTVIFASPSGLSLAHTVKPSTTGPTLGTTPTLEPWWRIRPSEDRSAILAESSMDGQHWVQFAVDPVPAPDKAFLELAMGSFAAGDPANAVIASINVCP